MFDIKKLLRYIIVLLITLQTSPGFAANKLQPATDKQLQKILPDFTQYADYVRKIRQTPGMAIAIVTNNKIIYVKGFGVRNIKDEPVTPETVFNIASLTKAFTAYKTCCTVSNTICLSKCFFSARAKNY